MIDNELEIQIDGLTISLPEPEDKISKLVGNPDFCPKKINLIDSDGIIVNIFDYNEGVLELIDGGRFTYYFEIQNYPSIKSLTYSLNVDFCAQTTIIDVSQSPVVNKLKVTLTEPLDTMSERYGFDTDKCKK